MKNKKPDYKIYHDDFCDYIMSYIVYEKNLYDVKKTFICNGKKIICKNGLPLSRIASFQNKKDAEEYVDFLNKKWSEEHDKK